ncbi:MAG: molybdopterin-dependent oxidoreductase [Syntrophobacteraceae bacterium]|nr:molybdopterin-dependent oxidoreductase [Syntrophobacteraceae bacterium]
MTRKTVATVCGICPGGCGVNVFLDSGKLEKISPIKDHPVGVMCIRGMHSKDIIYSSDRLKHPLARIGEKGEGKFEQVSWEEAVERIVHAFRKTRDAYGAQAVMSYFGRGSFDSNLVDVFGAPDPTSKGVSGFLHPFGSPNGTGVSSVCAVAYNLLSSLPTIGASMNSVYADFENTDLVVIWGANPPTDSPPDKVKKILAAQKRGARVIVIDHMRSDMAKKADQWIGIRSGTDGALALAVMHVIVKEGLYDQQFVRNWTTGFEELARYVEKFSPEKVEKITRVPRETICELARSIAGAKGASLLMYTGLEYSNCGVQTIRAVLCLWAITGNLDVSGAMMFRPRSPVKFGRVKLDPPPNVKPIGADRYPYFCDLLKSAQFLEAPRAILESDPYPVKALLILGASVLTSLPDPGLWKRCFKALDFMVVFDRFMTADAMYADIVLPATTNYENSGYQRYPGGYCQLRQKVIEPIAEAKSGYTFLVELAKGLGYGDLFPPTEEDRVKFIFENGPVSLEELKSHPEGVRYDAGTRQCRKYENGLLRKDGAPGFDTPSGKVELVSSLLAKYGYDGLPAYVEPSEGPLASPQLCQRYPLVFNSGARLQSAFRSQHLNIPALLKLQPKPHVLIHPLDARARGIENQDSVWVETPRGRVGFWAKVTDDVMTGQVEVNMGGGSPIQNDAWRQANTNYLTDFSNRDPISGFPVYKALLCEVRKRMETSHEKGE